LQDEQEIGILKKCTAELRMMRKSAGAAEFWMGQIEPSDGCDDPLTASR